MFISEHIVIHFIANRPSVCRALMVKAIEVLQMRHKPYASIEGNDFSNALVVTIWYRLKITECEHEYGAQKLC